MYNVHRYNLKKNYKFLFYYNNKLGCKKNFREEIVNRLCVESFQKTEVLKTFPFFVSFYKNNFFFSPLLLYSKCKLIYNFIDLMTFKNF